jgi:hypothetical protein
MSVVSGHARSLLSLLNPLANAGGARSYTCQRLTDAHALRLQAMGDYALDRRTTDAEYQVAIANEWRTLQALPACLIV